MKRLVYGSLAFAIAVMALASPAAATDIGAPAQAAPAAPACSAASCTGWTAGFNIAGTGSNLDVLGSGLAGSVFAGGGGLGLDAGYQYWDSRWFFGIEAFADYMLQNPSAGQIGTSPGWMAGQFVDVGLPIAALFGQAPAAPVGLPESIMQSLIAPYVKFGAMERPWGTAWATGAGAEFVVSKNWLLKLDYIHAVYQSADINPGAALKTDNILKVSARYKF